MTYRPLERRERGGHEAQAARELDGVGVRRRHVLEGLRDGGRDPARAARPEDLVAVLVGYVDIRVIAVVPAVARGRRESCRLGGGAFSQERGDRR